RAERHEEDDERHGPHHVHGDVEHREHEPVLQQVALARQVEAEPEHEPEESAHQQGDDHHVRGLARRLPEQRRQELPVCAHASALPWSSTQVTRRSAVTALSTAAESPTSSTVSDPYGRSATSVMPPYTTVPSTPCSRRVRVS